MEGMKNKPTGDKGCIGHAPVKSACRQGVVRPLSWGMIVIYVVLLIPLLVIGQYNFPSGDDFTMALGTRLVYEETGQILAVMQKILTETARYYRTWIGYFTSCLFTTVNPATFGEKWYPLSAVITLGGLHVGVIAFLYVLMEKVMGMNRYVRRCMTVLVLFLMIQLMPEGGLRVEAFYWYSGAGNYTLTFALGLLYLACLILAAGGNDFSGYGKGSCQKPLEPNDAPAKNGERHAGKGHIGFLIAACLLGFLTGGGNYLSALSYAIVSVCILGAVIVMRRRGRKNTTILPCILMLAGFAVNCMAPGNQVRGSSTEGYGAIKSILLSLYYTLSYPLNQWMNWAVLLILAVAGILFWMNLQLQDAEDIRTGGICSYRYPVLMTLFAYGLVSATITPALFAQGNIGAGRIQSTFWLHFILILVLLEWYLVGTLHRYVLGQSGWNNNPDTGVVGDSAGQASGVNHAVVHDRIRDDAEKTESRDPSAKGGTAEVKALAVLAGLFVVFSALMVKGNPYFYTFSSACEDLLNGSAKAYGEENEARLSLLTDSSVQDVVIQRHESRPELLYYLDISPEPEDWVNVKLCEYYHKNSVCGE